MIVTAAIIDDFAERLRRPCRAAGLRMRKEGSDHPTCWVHNVKLFLKDGRQASGIIPHVMAIAIANGHGLIQFRIFLNYGDERNPHNLLYAVDPANEPEFAARFDLILDLAMEHMSLWSCPAHTARRPGKLAEASILEQRGLVTLARAVHTVAARDTGRA